MKPFRHRSIDQKYLLVSCCSYPGSGRITNQRSTDATVARIDQVEKRVQLEPRATWSPRGVRRAAGFPGQRHWTRLVGTIIEGGACLSQFQECVTADHAEDFVLLSRGDSRDNLPLVVYIESCFRASAVTDIVARDDLAFVTSPEVHRDSIRPKSAGDEFRTLSAIGSSTYSPK